jgi:hypothetical protein
VWSFSARCARHRCADRGNSSGYVQNDVSVIRPRITAMSFSSPFATPFARVSSMADAMRKRKEQKESERMSALARFPRICVGVCAMEKKVRLSLRVFCVEFSQRTNGHRFKACQNWSSLTVRRQEPVQLKWQSSLLALCLHSGFGGWTKRCPVIVTN